MKLKFLIYGFIVFLSLNFCATDLMAKKNGTKIAEANSIVINNIQNIYITEYQNKTKNIESIFTIDELKTLEPKLLLNKYYETNKITENCDNKALFELIQEIDKFYGFIKDIKIKIQTEIKDNEIKINSMKQYKKLSYSFDYNLIPIEIKENILDSLNILIDKESDIISMGLDFEKNLYNNKLQEDPTYIKNNNLIKQKKSNIEQIKGEIKEIEQQQLEIEKNTKKDFYFYNATINKMEKNFK